MSEAFLYVQWLSAKSTLMNAMKDADTWARRCEIIDEWFQAHVFEVGVDQQVSDVYYCEYKSRLDEILLSERVCKLANEVIQKGLYMSVHNQPNWHTHNFQTTVLVFGSPKMVGPSTRKLL